MTHPTFRLSPLQLAVAHGCINGRDTLPYSRMSLDSLMLELDHIPAIAPPGWQTASTDSDDTSPLARHVARRRARMMDDGPQWGRAYYGA